MRTKVLALAAALAVAGCGSGGRSGGDRPGGGLSGTVRVDGSSTVFPISEAVAEEFSTQHPRVRVAVGESGTGGGFKKFCAAETDISNASRPIRPEEAAACQARGVGYLELKIATDGISVVVNPANRFADCLTVPQLRELWRPDSPVHTWRDLGADWPAEPIKLFGPGHDSGTFDFFTEAVVGEAKRSRSDYTASEDDNVLVQGIAAERNALGYFGFAYFWQNRSRLKVLGVDAGSGCVKPDHRTIREGTYAPLSRPLFIYVSKAALARPEVRELVRFTLDVLPKVVDQVGYVPLPAGELDAARRAFQAAAGR